ncbi:hypothetical protein FKW77_007856 [Venturia effusa]|uniref:Uncharacterized protein n=1 Tax=Venturia effusa TaxID=50376 RepID=A0A517LHM4_9PEZI|nr:hypothetical protein FKW77_007856 [Venturia effusa]
MRLFNIAAFFMGIVSVSGHSYEYCCCSTKDGCHTNSTKLVLGAVKQWKIPWDLAPYPFTVKDDHAPFDCPKGHCYLHEYPDPNPKFDEMIGVKEFSEYCHKYGQVGNGD